MKINHLRVWTLQRIILFSLGVVAFLATITALILAALKGPA